MSSLEREGDGTGTPARGLAFETLIAELSSGFIRDSINYFPPSASKPCAIVFFPDLTNRALPRDEIELSSTRACVGRLFFKVPGGIKYGQHFLNVKFEQSVVRVPLRILTEDEETFLSKNYKDIEKQVKDAFKKK
jgi:hypothetical protein